MRPTATSPGPARLCNALGITLEHDGTDLAGGPVTLTLGTPPADVSTALGSPPGGGRAPLAVPWGAGPSAITPGEPVRAAVAD